MRPQYWTAWERYLPKQQDKRLLQPVTSIVYSKDYWYAWEIYLQPKPSVKRIEPKVKTNQTMFGWHAWDKISLNIALAPEVSNRRLIEVAPMQAVSSETA